MGLADLIRTHGDALEADLQATYQVRLTDLHQGTLTWRRLSVLVRHLPADGVLARSRADGHLWTDTEHLLAGVFDSLQVLQWMYVAAHRDSDKPEPPYPRPLPRPGEEPAAEPAPASKYIALADVPAIAPHDLPAWVNS